MPKIKIAKIIKAPIEKVFDGVAHVDNFKDAAPHIIKIEMLSETTHGIGTRFKETRIMNNRESSTILECTEYDKNNHVRFIADQGGTIWDSIFFTKPENNNTLLEMEMEARPYKFMARIITPTIMGMVKKAVADDMVSIQNWCENNAE